MNPWIQATAVLLPSGYLLCAVLYGMAFAGKKQPAFAHIRRPILAVVILLHVLFFVLIGRETGAFPIAGAWLTVSGVALSIALLLGAVTLRNPQPTVASLVLAIVFLLQLCSSAFGPVQAPSDLAPPNTVKIVHAVCMLGATATVVLSGVYGLLHLLLYRQMRAKRFGALFQQLPDLTQLARSTRASALWGFLLLTLGLNVGIGVAHATGTEGFRYTDPQVILIMGLWIHFGVIAFSRVIQVVNARHASYAAVAGLAVLLTSLVIMVLPGLSFHSVGTLLEGTLWTR